MPAIALSILRFLGGTALFVTLETGLEKVFDQDDEHVYDELLAMGATTAGVSQFDKIKIKSALKSAPLPAGVDTPAAAAEYLQTIANNKKGLAELNARLGGYAPLAIRFTKAVADFLTKRTLMKMSIATAVVSFTSWVIWSPNFLQQILDQGVFNPEQANDIFDAWGIPEKYRWPTDVGGISGGSKSSGETGGSTSSAGTAKIIIRMVEEKKPEQFIGTLFSAKLGAMQSFERHVDDEITDEADLLEDAKLNLNRWLQSFAGRLGYSIVIRKDPVDEYGTKQSGIWATMTMHITRLNGGIQPIDTILLGPVSPKTKLVLSKTLKTIEQQLPGALTADTVRVIEVPTGTVDVFDAAGEKVAGTSTISIASKAATAAPATAAVAAAAPSAEVAALKKQLDDAQAAIDALQASKAAPTPTPSTPTSTPAVTPPVEAQPSGGSPLASSPLQQSPLLQGSAVATSPVLTPAQPEYDKSKYFQGVRGARDDRWPWYGNRFVRVNVGSGNLHIREGASTTLPIKWKAPHGSVIVFKRWIGVRDGYDWGEVTDASGTKSGFAALMYLELT